MALPIKTVSSVWRSHNTLSLLAQLIPIRLATILVIMSFSNFKPCTTFCDKICPWLVTVRWISQGPPVSSTNKTYCQNITEILLKKVLNTIKPTNRLKFQTYPIIQIKFHDPNSTFSLIPENVLSTIEIYIQPKTRMTIHTFLWSLHKTLIQ